MFSAGLFNALGNKLMFLFIILIIKVIGKTQIENFRDKLFDLEIGLPY